jgi:hypothetical protein
MDASQPLEGYPVEHKDNDGVHIPMSGCSYVATLQGGPTPMLQSSRMKRGPTDKIYADRSLLGRRLGPYGSCKGGKRET